MSDLAEKKKEFNEKTEEPKVLYEVSITADDNERVVVKGPIDDPVLMMKIFSHAMDVVADHNLRNRMEIEEEEKKTDKIITLN